MYERAHRRDPRRCRTVDVNSTLNTYQVRAWYQVPGIYLQWYKYLLAFFCCCCSKIIPVVPGTCDTYTVYSIKNRQTYDQRDHGIVRTGSVLLILQQQ